MTFRLSIAGAAVALAFAAAVPAAAQTTVLATVGDSPASCQFDEIQDAIDACRRSPPTGG